MRQEFQQNGLSWTLLLNIMNLHVNWYRIFIFFLVLAPKLGMAMHIVGGEMTYQCIGNGQSPNTRVYRFTLIIYRDCIGQGADYDSPGEFAIYRGSVNANSLYDDFPIDYTSRAFIIPDTPDCVEKIPNVCVERAVYSFQRTLPINATQSYFVVYQRCCRNVTINNLINPGDLGATFMVELTPFAQQNCNNSPTFKDFPPIIICKGVPLIFDHSAIDVDGDSLVYSFCPPLQGGGPLLTSPALISCNGAKPTPPCAPPYDPVPFTAPVYTATNPLGGDPVVNINTLNGLISGTPEVLGQFVVGVCVNEYRNGQLISQIQRDFQFNVADCSPTVVANIRYDSVTAVKSFLVKSCGETTITIINESQQKSKITRFKWLFDLKGTPFVDSTNWDVTINFPDTGIYSGLLLLNPGTFCGDTAFLTVQVFPEIIADFSYDYDTCTAGPIAFTDQSVSEGSINYWAWNFGDGATAFEQNPVHEYATSGEYPARLTVRDKNFCQADTIKNIRYFPVPPFIVPKPNEIYGCVPATITFDTLPPPISQAYDIEWNLGDGTLSADIAPIHTYTSEGVYTVSIAVTSPIGCFFTDTFVNLIKVDPSPTAGFSYSPNSGLSNLNNIVSFTDQSLAAVAWSWFFGNYGTSIAQNPVYSFPDTGLTTVTLIVSHPSGCKDTAAVTLDIRPEVRWFMPNAFTPNGDGTNEGFLGKGFLVGVQTFHMSIWNRWGEMVYKTSDPESPWDGNDSRSGNPAPAGVYTYLVSFTGPRGELFEFKGFATLIR